MLGSPAFMGQALFPEFFVLKESDKYYTYKDRESLRRLDSRRAIGDPSREIDFKPSTETYSCEEYSLSKLLADRLMRNADSPTRLREVALRLIREWIDRDLEADIIKAVTQGGLDAATPSVKWDAGSGTIDIEGDIDTGKLAIQNNGGGIANTILFNTGVKNAIKTDSTVRNLLRYTVTGFAGKELVVNGELPPVLWGLKINVAGAVENTGLIGAADSISTMWGNHAIIAQVDSAPSLESKTLGLQFTVRQGGTRGAPLVKTFRDERRAGTRYEMSMLKDNKIVATQCGYNLHSVLT
jgi:hypothetical protein